MKFKFDMLKDIVKIPDMVIQWTAEYEIVAWILMVVLIGFFLYIIIM